MYNIDNSETLPENLPTSSYHQQASNTHTHNLESKWQKGALIIVRGSQQQN